MIFSYNFLIDDKYFNFTGCEIASVIFLFILGLNSFKEDFLFLSVNNVPRKVQFKGFLVSSLLVSCIISAIDITYFKLLQQFVPYHPIFEVIYDGWLRRMPTPLGIITNFIWSVLLYIATFLIGYLISNFYYYMNRAAKIAISVGVSVWFIIVFPIIDLKIMDGKLTQFISDTIIFLAGIKFIDPSTAVSNPCIPVVSLSVISIVTVGLSYLMMSRATVKK